MWWPPPSGPAHGPSTWPGFRTALPEDHWRATTHTPAPASQTRGETVVNLPPRRPTNPHQVIAHLPEDTRPLPTVTAYDELLCRRQPDPAPAPAETHHHTPTGTP